MQLQSYSRATTEFNGSENFFRVNRRIVFICLFVRIKLSLLMNEGLSFDLKGYLKKDKREWWVPDTRLLWHLILIYVFKHNLVIKKTYIFQIRMLRFCDTKNYNPKQNV